MDAPITLQLASHITDTGNRTLNGELDLRVRMLLLDALIAIISGSTLRPGRAAVEFASKRPGRPASTVAGSGQKTAPEIAALANGTCAHADETDDTNELVPGHHGAAIVPGALAAAEDAGSSGQALLEAIELGYHLNSIIPLSAWQGQLTNLHPRGLAQPFGAAAAAAYLYGLDTSQVAQALTYAIQQVAGLHSFYRDSEHIEKAFVSGGQQASAGVAAARMVQAGCTAVEDGFDTEPNYFSIFGNGGDGRDIADLLKNDSYALAQNLKRFPVGMPLQAPMQAMRQLFARQSIDASDVVSLECRLPTQKLVVVDVRDMPDIDARYALATYLLKGDIDFDDAHDYERAEHPEVRAIMDRIRVVGDAELDTKPGEVRNTRRAAITVTLKDGRELAERVEQTDGTWIKPFAWADVAAKAHDILDRSIGAARTELLIETVHDIGRADDLNELTAQLAV